MIVEWYLNKAVVKKNNQKYNLKKCIVYFNQILFFNQKKKLLAKIYSNSTDTCEEKIVSSPCAFPKSLMPPFG